MTPEPWSDEWIIAKFGQLFSGLGVYNGPKAFDDRMYPAIRAIAAKAMEEAEALLRAHAANMPASYRRDYEEAATRIRVRAKEIADGE